MRKSSKRRKNVRKRRWHFTNYSLGTFYETIAVIFLILKGYRILARRFQTPFGELDIVMNKGDILIAVEVKSRITQEIAYYAVTPYQQRRIQKGLLIAQQRFASFQHLRCDVVLISPFKWPIHIINAF